MKDQVKCRIPSGLRDRIVRDSRAYNRSIQTIASVALTLFYNLPVPEREAILMKQPAIGLKGRRA